MAEWYDRDGNPMTMQEYSAKLRNPDYRHVGLTEFECPSGEAKASTVWLGIDHNFFAEGPPIIYETMIFCNCEGEIQHRYATVEEARQGHEKAVKEHRGYVDYELHKEGWMERDAPL